MINYPTPYEETGDIKPLPKRIFNIKVKSYGIQKVVVVRTKKNGGIK